MKKIIKLINVWTVITTTLFTIIAIFIDRLIIIDYISGVAEFDPLLNVLMACTLFAFTGVTLMCWSFIIMDFVKKYKWMKEDEAYQERINMIAQWENIYS